MNLVSCGLSALLLPLDRKSSFPCFQFGQTGFFWLDRKVLFLTSAVIAAKINPYCALPYINIILIHHLVLLSANGLSFPVCNLHAGFPASAVIHQLLTGKLHLLNPVNDLPVYNAAAAALLHLDAILLKGGPLQH